MGKVVLDITMSLDGLITGAGDDVERLHRWILEGSTDRDAELLEQGFAESGAVVMGRRTFDLVDGPEGWRGPGGESIRTPVFVPTHHPPETAPEGPTPFTFVPDGVEAAVGQAHEAAGDKAVTIMGANTAQQCIAAGLLDEILLHVAPVLLGEGIRLFEHLGAQPVELERTRVLETPAATHLWFRVMK